MQYNNILPRCYGGGAGAKRRRRGHAVQGESGTAAGEGIAGAHAESGSDPVVTPAPERARLSHSASASCRPYIADFACVPGRLVIEVDGATHASDKEVAYDNRRDAYLHRLGWRVMRIRNEDIYRNLDTVLDAVWAALHAPSAHLQPAASMGTSPARGGGEGKVW